jgi:hypothetical protein
MRNKLIIHFQCRFVCKRWPAHSLDQVGKEKVLAGLLGMRQASARQAALTSRSGPLTPELRARISPRTILKRKNTIQSGRVHARQAATVMGASWES